MKKYTFFFILLCSSIAWGQTTTDNPHTSNAKMQYRSVSNVGITFSQLYTAVPQYNGTTTYCKDCQQSSVCQSGGTGAIAEALGGVWNCAALSAILPPNINASVNGQINIMSPQYAGGAKCDGSTDDTNAIQTAVYAACGGTPSISTAGPHPEVYFPYNQTKCFHKYPIHVPCSNISITGPHQGSVAGLSQFYIGPAMLVQSYGARNLEYGAALVGTGQSLNLKSYTSDSKGLVPYNYLLNSAVQAMNGLGNFNIHFVFNVTSLTGSGGFTQPIFASSLTVQSSANGATNRAFYTQITNTSTFDAGLNMSTGAVAFDSFSPSINTNYEVELNRSGNNCQEFINGVQNGATKTCTGTLQMDPYEVVTVPSVGIARWPFAGSNNNPAWGFIDTIKIENVSVHTSNYTPSTTTGVRPIADANTMLLDNFLTPTAQEQDTDPVYVASTTLNAFLPVYLRDGGAQNFGVHLSYLDVGTDLEMSEEPLSEVDHIYNSQNAQYIGMDLHSGNFVSAVHDNSLSGGSLCINYGTGFSESGLVSNNRCSQAGTALHTCYNSDSSSYSETGAYCQDNTNSNFDLIFPFIDYASHIQHHEPFVDEEGPGSALKASFGLVISPFGPESVSDGELSTGTFSVPFIQQQGGSPIMVENFDLVGGSSMPEIFNITSNPTGQNLIINSKLPANTPTSNLPQFVKQIPDNNNIVNILDFGPKCDGTTDDTVILQAAINYAESFSPPKKLYLPWTSNYCKVSSLNATNLTQGFTFIGDTPAVGATELPTFDIHNGLFCQGASANYGPCIDVSGSWSVDIENIRVTDCVSSGCPGDTHYPAEILLSAKTNNNAAGNSQGITLRGDSFFNFGGAYTWYNYGAEENSSYRTTFSQGKTADVVLSSSNTAGITSPFATLNTAPASMTISSFIDDVFVSTSGSLGFNMDTASGSIGSVKIDGGYYQQGSTAAYTQTGGNPVDGLSITDQRTEPQGGIVGEVWFIAAAQISDFKFWNDTFANTVIPTNPLIQFNKTGIASATSGLINLRPADSQSGYPSSPVISCAAPVNGVSVYPVDQTGGLPYANACVNLTTCWQGNCMDINQYHGSGANAIPACTASLSEKFVSDGVAGCTYGVAYAAGAGAALCKVGCNGTNWLYGY